MGQIGETRYAALAAAIRAGGDLAREAMDELVRAERSHLAKSLWREYPALREEIEDIVAEAFERVWQCAHRCECFSPSGSYAAFRALVAKQASYLALSAARKAASRKAKADIISLDSPTADGRTAREAACPLDWEQALVGRLDARATLDRVACAMHSLTERQRIIVRVLLEENAEDVNAAVVSALGISDGAAREAKRAVRERLRRLLEA